MTKTYGAINPQQIIDLFEMRAKIADAAAQRANAKGARRELEQEAYTWRDAADILRNTEFVGWTNDSRIVEEIKQSNTPAAQEAARKIGEGVDVDKVLREYNKRMRPDGSTF